MALLLGYGLMSAQRLSDDPRSWAEVYDDELELAVAAEEAGFDSLWVTEHHFTTDGYLSASLPMLAALAGRTTRAVLGTNVLLAPLHNPLRIAQDTAAVACLAGGRTILGIGIGYRDEEFEAFGVPKSERVPRIREHIDVCRAAWTGEPFTHSGPVVSVENLLCRPVPPGPPEIWLGGWVDASIVRAARYADGYISPGGGMADTERRVAILDEAQPDGRLLPIATANLIAVGGVTPAIQRGCEHMMENYGEWYSSSSDLGGGSEVGEAIRGRTDPTAGVLAGSSEELIDILSPFAERFSGERDHHMVLRLHYPGMSREEGLDHISRFSEEVAPALG